MGNYKRIVVIFVDLLGTKKSKNFEDEYLIHSFFHSEVKINEERNLSYAVYDRKLNSFSNCAYFFYNYKKGVEDSCDYQKLISA